MNKPWCLSALLCCSHSSLSCCPHSSIHQSTFVLFRLDLPSNAHCRNAALTAHPCMFECAECLPGDLGRYHCLQRGRKLPSMAAFFNTLRGKQCAYLRQGEVVLKSQNPPSPVTLAHTSHYAFNTQLFRCCAVSGGFWQ